MNMRTENLWSLRQSNIATGTPPEYPINGGLDGNIKHKSMGYFPAKRVNLDYTCLVWRHFGMIPSAKHQICPMWFLRGQSHGAIYI